MKLTKTALTLIIIVFLAFGLRLFSAAHVDIGSDEIIYSLIPLHIIDAHRLSTIEEAPVYFYLTDLSYKLFGNLTLISTRFTSIIFGATATILIYLISLKIFNHKKAALLSSFLFALSGYAIHHNQEMDMTAFFLSLLSMYFFLNVLEGKHNYLYLSTIILAIATLVKPLVLLLLPAYAIVWLWQGYISHNGLIYKKEKRWHYNTNLFKILIFCFVTAIIIVSPILTYNYLLYKEKGMTDYYFTVFAGIGNNQVYQSQEAEPWTISRFVTLTRYMATSILKSDPFLLILGLLGIPLALKKHKPFSVFILLGLIIYPLYLLGKTASSTHYVWIPLILSIFAGYTFVYFSERILPRILPKLTLKKMLYIFCVILVVTTSFNMYHLSKLKESSIQNILNEYAVKNIPNQAIVILDPRVYRGVYTWALVDKHYLEGTYFPKLIENLNQFPGPTQTVPFYYIECGPGKYCGWKPEDYQRISSFGQQLSSSLTPNMKKIYEIHTADTLIVYQGTINVPLSVYETIDRTHNHWYTPIGWKYPDQAVDNYTPKTFFDKTLNTLSFIVLYFDVFIAVISIFWVFFLIFRKEKFTTEPLENHNQQPLEKS